MYGIIYEAINKINNKRYIGQTKCRLCQRKTNHKTLSKTNGAVFYQAIRKYGWDNFEWKIIDYAISKEDLDNKEIFWILFFNTYKQGGYNMTTGGQYNKEDVWRKYGRSYENNLPFKKKFMVFDKQGNYIKTTINQNAFASEIGVTTTCVGSVLNGHKNSVSDYILFFEDDFTTKKLKEHIKQLRNTHEFTIFDYKTNDCLGIWTNFTRCSEDTGFSRRTMERQLIQGLKTHARKFIIKYISDCDENELSIVDKIKDTKKAS